MYTHILLSSLFFIIVSRAYVRIDYAAQPSLLFSRREQWRYYNEVLRAVDSVVSRQRSSVVRGQRSVVGYDHAETATGVSEYLTSGQLLVLLPGLPRRSVCGCVRVCVWVCVGVRVCVYGWMCAGGCVRVYIYIYIYIHMYFIIYY